jgi:hypothetical protein
MVPSWTETLIACGANVVGRTRFCIHPKISIPVVGGTKDIDWEKVHKLKPDLLVLDREENPKAMADESPFKVHASHVTRAQDLPAELEELAGCFEEKVRYEIRALGKRWQNVLARERRIDGDLRKRPGLIEWISPAPATIENRPVIYVIWKKPWMAANRGTFISSMLELTFCSGEQIGQGLPNSKYPEFNLEGLSPDSILLFSSEPFPFAKFKKEIANLPFASALVDGEAFSWFGLRSLLFVEELQQRPLVP